MRLPTLDQLQDEGFEVKEVTLGDGTKGYTISSEYKFAVLAAHVARELGWRSVAALVSSGASSVTPSRIGVTWVFTVRSTSLDEEGRLGFLVIPQRTISKIASLNQRRRKLQESMALIDSSLEQLVFH
jgi:hypothetical protein